MRRVVMLVAAVAAVVACAKTETPAADTSAAAMAPAPAPAPAPVTEAEAAGTWTGVSMPMGSDSVLFKWTQVCAAGKCTGTSEGSKVTTHATYTLAGDSAVGVSEPVSDPQIAKGAKVVDSWVVHFKGDSATGTGAMKLASKPDSIVLAYHFVGTRKR